MTGQQDSPAGLSFERDVRPMFREKDRDSMLKAFDLWSHSDVQAPGPYWNEENEIRRVAGGG